MKTDTIQFDLGNGATIAVETTNPVLEEGAQSGLASIGIADKTVDTLKNALTPLQSFATIIRDALVSANPAETEVEFGVKIEGKNNLVVTAGSLEANLKVTLKWRQNHSQSAQ